MADDPNRDLLPVRDSSYVETYRSIIAIPSDPRERHTVSKIDRNDLEDKYLRLLEECQELKKLSNSQEDKIKRLATKLMRVSATPRTYIPASLDVDSDKNKIDILKMENNKLRDKIIVLRNQILSHRVLRRSPSQTRRLAVCTSSRPTTCRSESGRMKTSTCQNFINDREDDIVNRNYVNKFGEWEEQRKQMIARINELENKLALLQAGNQKDKIAENVEYIRIWRQMKLEHEKLVEAEAMKKILCTQIEEMKILLDETTKVNGEIVATRDVEKKEPFEIDEELMRTQENVLREKDEEIRDLMSEMKILQQHNSELINISTKYSQVEMKHSELKKKLSESLTDNHNLKSTLSNEQTNMKALQAANVQLMDKLQSTQSDIDNLTIQLKSVQNQYDNAIKNINEAEIVRKEMEKKYDKQTSTTSLLTACESIDVINKKTNDNPENYVSIDNDKMPESQQQSSSPSPSPSSSCSKQDLDCAQTPASDIEIPIINRHNSTPSTNNYKNGTKQLSPSKILKLLDDAQINTPLNTQNAISVRQIEDLSPKSYVNAHYRQSSKSMDSSSQSPTPTPQPSSLPKTVGQNKIKDQDHRDIIKLVSRILKDYCRTHFNEIDEDSMTIFRSTLPPSSDDSINVEEQLADHKLVTSSSSLETHDSYDQNNNNILSKIHDDNLKQSSSYNWNFEKETVHISMTNINHECEERVQCICDEVERCFEHCGYSTDNMKCVTKISYHSFLAAINDINTSLEKATIDNQQSRPVSKTIQLKTGLCCEPNNPIKDEYLKDYPAIMEKVSMHRYQVNVIAKSSMECKRSCPLANYKNINDVSYIVEKNENQDNSIDTQDRYAPVLITGQEGLLEIHILSLQFSPLVENTLFNKSGNIIERSLFIRCEFSNEKPISTSVITYPDLNFNSSCIYRIANLDELFNNIYDKSVYLQLHIVFHKELSYVIAHGKINIKNILIYPQNKLHYFTVNMESLVPCYHNKKFGQLSLWMRLSCDPNRVKLFNAKKQFDRSDTSSPINTKIKQERLSSNSVSQNNTSSKPIVEMIHERPPRHLNPDDINSNQFNSTSSSPDSSNSFEMVQRKNSPHVSIVKTEEPSLDSLKNPWQQWESKNDIHEIHTPVDRPRKIPNRPVFHSNYDSNHHEQIDDGNDAVVIMIDRLKLMQNCPLLYNSNIHRLYIEFSFLGKHGVDYETVSVPIPKSYTEDMYFNYVKKFRIDEKKHLNERNHLRNMLSGEKNPNVQFNVVSEPLNEVDTEECIDVGHAYLNLTKHVLSKGKPDVFLTVKNPENTESIGVLKISILGMNAIRQLLSKSSTMEQLSYNFV